MPLKLLDKYLFTQVLWSFLFGLALVIIVWIAPELLPNVVRDVVAQKITAFQGILIILYELPEVLVKSLPMGMLIGSLLVFDRLSKDSEITAMRACGIGVYRMLTSIIVLGLIGCFIVFFINEAIVPPTSIAQEKILNKGKIISSHFTYVDKDIKGTLKQVILIDYYDGKIIKNIRILNFKQLSSSKSSIEEIFAAASAKWVKDHWLLVKGISYKLNPLGVYEDTIMFEETPMASDPKVFNLLNKSLKKPKNMNLFEIGDYIALLIDSQHSDEARYYKVRYHQKFSQPFAAIILAIVGLILGVHPPRTSRFLGYTVGMFVILLYYFVWPLCMALGNIGAIHPFLAAWIPNFMAIFIALGILKLKNF